MNEQEIYTRIDAIAAKLELTAGQMFIAFRKKMLAEALIDSFYAFGGLLMAVSGGVGVRHFSERLYVSLKPAVELRCHPTGVYGPAWCESMTVATSDGFTIIYALATTLCVLFALIGLRNIWDNGSDAIREYMAPDALAAEEIIELVRGDA